MKQPAMKTSTALYKPIIGAIVRRINQREETLSLMLDLILGKAASFMGEVLLQGKDLLELKALVPHGEWENCLEENCPGSIRSARSYMRLAAKPELAAAFIAAGSIRKALGLLAEEESTHSQARRWPAYLEALGRLNKLIGFVERNPVQQWPKEGVEQMRADLLPLVTAIYPEKFA